MKKTTSKIVSLNGSWQMRDEPLDAGQAHVRRIERLRQGWLDTPVPGNVHQGLLAAGEINEPLVGLNSLACRWIEDRSWWFRKTFRADAAMCRAQAVELELHGLDVHAAIFLNGRHLGDHPSAFRPFVARIEKFLQSGPNTLLVRLTHGLENVSPGQVAQLGGEIPTEKSRGYPERQDSRRVFVRKAQFSWGWDWSPRLATVGITGDVKIHVRDRAVIRDVQATPGPPGKRGKNVALTVRANVEWLDGFQSGVGRVRWKITDPEGNVAAQSERDVFLQTGFNFFDTTVTIKEAQLWWPTGLGPQARYDITCEVLIGNTLADLQRFPYGIRFLQLDARDTFALRVNDQNIFCKGANWIPPDALYGRIADAKIRQLVTQARQANFNMLRVWGGGIYPPEAFYDACDREGILVWQDFMFACAPYPDHLESFRQEIAHEAAFQTRRLRHHPSLALWCGSNECLQFQLPNTPQQTTRGSILWGQILPRAVRQNCPEIPYWYCSPYGGSRYDDQSAGDIHYWQIGLHDDPAVRTDPRLYDRCESFFVSEFGYPGPCGKESTAAYLDSARPDRTSKAWKHHNNTFERDTVAAGIDRHYAASRNLALDDYLFLGQLTQGLMYNYSLESLRAKPRCHGALFWMFNDSWGEVGWSVIDYYLRRKIAWYFVRRALAAQRLILREENHKIRIILANDGPKALAGLLEYGYLTFDGQKSVSRQLRFEAPAQTRTLLKTFSCGGHDPHKGLWFARLVGRNDFPHASLLLTQYRQADIPPAKLSCRVTPGPSNQYRVTLKSDVFAHAVHFTNPGDLQVDDNFFDLLPGQQRAVTVRSARKLAAQDFGVGCWNGRRSR